MVTRVRRSSAHNQGLDKTLFRVPRRARLHRDRDLPEGSDAPHTGAVDRGRDDGPGGTPAGPHIVVPNDARELARDVEAWRREQRWAQRRRILERRLPVLPRRAAAMSAPLVIAVLLAVAMLGATIATAGRPTTHDTTPPVPLVLAAPSIGTGLAGGLVPDVALRGLTGTTSARQLRPAVLAVMQAGCGCAAALARLADEAAGYGLTVYLVGGQAQQAELTALAARVNRGDVSVLVEQGSALSAFSGGGLTAVGVHADGVIEAIADGFSRTTSFDRVLAGLKQPAHAGA